MVYCDGFIFGCGGSYADKKASWDRAAKEKLRREEEEFLAKEQEQEEQEEKEEVQVIDDMSDEDIIDNIETIIKETLEDCYNEGM